MKQYNTAPRVGDEVVLRETETTEPNPPRFSEKVGGVARKALGLGALSIVSGIGLATTVSTKSSCGPHLCEVQLQLDNFATINAGPLGSARVPLQQRYPVPTGVHIQLQEIPFDEQIESAEQPFIEPGSAPLDDERVQEVAQLYSTLESDLKVMPGQLVHHVAKLSGLSAATFAAGYSLLGKTRRKELTEKTNSAMRLAAPAVLSMVLIAPPLIPVEDSSNSWLQSGTAFNNTIFEGIELKGIFGRYSLEGIRQVVDYNQEVRDYYSAVADTVEQALLESQPFATYEDEPNIVKVIRTTDLHCNYGMNEVLTRIADTASVDAWVDTGDMVMSGSSFEHRCIDAISKHMPKARVVAPGNHESDTTAAQFESAGFTVVDGSIQTVVGIPIIGLPDPNRSPFGGTEKYDAQRTKQLGRQLLTTACGGGVKPVLLTHSAEMATETIRSGCADIGFAGHSHSENEQFIPQQDGETGHLLVAGSSGGAKKGELTIGTLKAPAYVYLDALQIETDGSATLLESNAITISPNNSVSIDNIYTATD